MKEITFATKKDYLAVINFLEKQTKYVEIVVSWDDTPNSPLLTNFGDSLVTIKDISHWLETGTKGTLYKYALSLERKKAYFQQLRKFDSFFYNCEHPFSGMYVETTDFGYQDIAFFNLQGELLFYTITHEGLAWIKKSAEENK